jgi:hypothetical protein
LWFVEEKQKTATYSLQRSSSSAAVSWSCSGSCRRVGLETQSGSTTRRDGERSMIDEAAWRITPV